MVRVRLHVANDQPTRYVVVDDPLPSVMEAVNPEFASQSSSAWLTGSLKRWHWVTDYQEIRDDRVLFFYDHLSQTGTFELRYLARVTSEGEVIVPSTKVEAMYDPDRYALSAHERLRTLALKK